MTINKLAIIGGSGIYDVEEFKERKLLDIDANGQVHALTDGLIVLRYMFGFTGDELISDAIAESATRTTAAEIEAYLAALIPEL